MTKRSKRAAKAEKTESETSLGSLFDGKGNPADDQQFRVLTLAHAMSVNARLTTIEAALVEFLKPKNKGGRLRDAYADVFADIQEGQLHAAELAKAEVLETCADIPGDHVERVLRAFLGSFYDLQRPVLRARAEARYRNQRASANPKAALDKAVQRRSKRNDASKPESREDKTQC